MDAVRREEELVRSLLAPLQEVEPATLSARRSRRNAYIVFAAVALAVVVTGVAIARSLNPLSGIGAADRPSEPADALGPTVQTQLRLDRPPSGVLDQIGGRLTDSARFVGTLPSGRRIYVVPTTKGRLCVVLAGSAESCGNPLTQTEPITFTIVFDHPADPTYAYGVARDGVIAVSFTVAPDKHVTVPVEHNLFVYESEPSSSPRGITDLKVTFADGSVKSLR